MTHPHSTGGEWRPVKDYFKSRMVFMALQASTKAKRKERLTVLYEARTLTCAEVMNLLQKNELKHA